MSSACVIAVLRCVCTISTCVTAVLRNAMKKLNRLFRKISWKTLLLLLALGLTVAALRHFLRRRGGVKVIGYACFKNCGGWADRQKGIVGAFVLASMLGKQFKLHMPQPCDLSYFLMPGPAASGSGAAASASGSGWTGLPVDWRITPEELKRAQVGWYRYINSNSLDFAKDVLNEDHPEELFSTDYVFLTTNVEIVHILRQHRSAKRLRWLQEKTIPEIYHLVLTQLFTFMPGLQNMWDTFWLSIAPHTKLICAQMRAGGTGDTESFNTVKDFAGLAAFLTPYNASSSSSASSYHHSSSQSSPSTSQYRFLFTSDKAFMVEHAHRLFPTLSVSLSGPFTHVDRSSGSDVCAGMARVIVEQLVLSTCHVLVISESGLGKVAAFLRNTDTNLFLFHDGVVERTTRETRFPNRPAW